MGDFKEEETKKKRLPNSKDNLKEAANIKNGIKCVSEKLEKKSEKCDENSQSHILNKNIKKRYSEEYLTTSAEKKRKSEAPSKARHNSGKSLKKDKIFWSRPRKDVENPFINCLFPYFTKFYNVEGCANDTENSDNVKSSDEATDKMIYISLDFLEECQKYKKKYRKRMNNEPKVAKKINRSVSNTNQCLNKDSKDQQFIKKDENRKGAKVKISLVNEKGKREILYTEFDDHENYEMQEGKQELLKETSSQQCVGKCLNILPEFSKKENFEENISKIDIKNIKSLLRAESDHKILDDKVVKMLGQKQASENPVPSKIKLTGKKFFEEKIKNKRAEEEKIKKEREEEERDSQNFLKKEEKKAEKSDQPSIEKSFQSRGKLLRVLTQSENQFKLRKNSINTKDSSETEKTVKNEKVVFSKLEIKEFKKHKSIKNQRKRLRKHKNNLLKSQLFIRDPKEAGVKELWRRVTEKSSGNSLSSHSSATTLIRGNPTPAISDLRSYNDLIKIVQEEVRRISKTFKNIDIEIEEQFSVEKLKENKEIKHDLIHELKNETKSHEKGDLGSSVLLENSCTGLAVPAIDNFGDFLDTNDENTDFAVKRGILNHKKFLNEKGDTHKFCARIEDIEENLKFLAEKNNDQKNNPKMIIKNWSILHRLEKAFLALGTPKIQHKSRMSTTLSVKARPLLIKATSKILQKRNSKMIENENEEKKKVKGEKIYVEPRKTNDCSNSKKKKELYNKKSSDNLVLSPNPKFLEEKTKPGNKKSDLNSFQKERKFSGKSIKELRQPESVLFSCKKINTSESNPVKEQYQRERSSSTTRNESNSKFNISFINSKINDKSFKLTLDPKTKINSTKRKIKEISSDRLEKRKPSKIQLTVSTSSNKNEDNLERKRTFDVIPNDSCNILAQKSKSCNEIDHVSDQDLKPRHSSTSKQDYRGPLKKNIDCRKLLQENVNADHKKKTRVFETDQSMMSEIKSRRKLLKKSTKEKLNPAKKVGVDKQIIKNNFEIPQIVKLKGKDRLIQLEEFPQQIYIDVVKAIKKNIINERAIKERSILSIRNQHKNQGPLKNLPHESEIPNTFAPNKMLKNVSQQKNTSMTSVHKNLQNSDASVTSTKTYDIVETKPQASTAPTTNRQFAQTSCKNPDFTYLPSLSNISTKTYDASPSAISTRNSLNNAKKLPTPWEQNIRCYKAIVKDIMNQYKRIDGLLKHSENLKNDAILSDCMEAKDSNFQNSFCNEQGNNINEYRKKIISEYQALPIFEYKTKIREKEKKVGVEEFSTKRNLLAVNDLDTEMDLDVKDFQPSIQKVLDSQLYVDTENLFKRTPPIVKIKEKKSSLQEIFSSGIEQTISKENLLDRWQRTLSSPKTLAFT